MISVFFDYRLWDERVNCSEQHDAQEFFSCLVDTADEAMKLCGAPKAIESVMGGTFEDQKICIDCPHRYSFTLSIVIMPVVTHQLTDFAIVECEFHRAFASPPKDSFFTS